jgi:hypothetical protein
MAKKIGLLVISIFLIQQAFGQEQKKGISVSKIDFSNLSNLKDAIEKFDSEDRFHDLSSVLLVKQWLLKYLIFDNQAFEVLGTLPSTTSVTSEFLESDDKKFLYYRFKDSKDENIVYLPVQKGTDSKTVELDFSVNSLKGDVVECKIPIGLPNLLLCKTKFSHKFSVFISPDFL